MGKIKALNPQAHFVLGRPLADYPGDRDSFEAVFPEIGNGLFDSDIAASLAAAPRLPGNLL
jgi:hypothetical protein